MAVRIGDASAGDVQWLNEHLAVCSACADAVAALDSALADVRAQAAVADSLLVRTTQVRVREEADLLRRQVERMRPLWIVAALVSAYALVSTAAAWLMFGWAAAWLHVPSSQWQAAFGLLWIAPSVAASILLLGYGTDRAHWPGIALRQSSESS